MKPPPDRIGSRKGKAFLEIVLTLPPTDNNIYFNATSSKKGYKQSIRVLTNEAKKYKRSAAMAVAELAIYDQVEFKKDVPYLCVIKVFFENTENKGWPEGGAKTRYKRVDTTNRNKLLIDSIMEALGIDDSHIFPVIKFKRADHDDPRVEVGVYEMTDNELEQLDREVGCAIKRVLLWD